MQDGSPEQKVLQKANKYKWILLASAAVLVLGQFAGLIIAGVEALIALILTIVVVIGLVYFLPVIAMKAANRRLKAITSEAEQNPIETLQNDYVYRQDQLQKADDSIRDFDMEIRNYDDQCRSFKEQYPDEADSFMEISTAMHAGLFEMKQEQTTARAAVAALAQKIKKAEALYKMALAAQKVTAYSKTSQEKVFADIKQQVAFDSVRSQLNRSFASLDRAMAKRTELSSKAAVPTLTITANQTYQSEPVVLRRTK